MNYSICFRKNGKPQYLYLQIFAHAVNKVKKMHTSKNYYELLICSHSEMCSSTLENELEDNSSLSKRKKV